jgi:hypothetical protein
MKVGYLIEELQYLNPDMEVKIASQPNWPLEYSIGSVSEVGGEVYLVEKTQLGYLSQEVCDEIGW